MHNTLALFGLFALFTTGSAADGCTGGGDEHKYCKKPEAGINYIGQCDGSSACIFKNCVAPAAIHDPCGDGKTFSGNCVSSTGMCKYSEFVKVEYTAKAAKTQADTVAQAIDSSVFQGNFVTAMTRYSRSSGRDCAADDNVAHTVIASGKTVCKDSTVGGCSVDCAAKYTKTTDTDYKCGYSSGTAKWSGSEPGVCSKRCPVPTAATGSFDVASLGGTEEDGVVKFTDRIAHGKYECTDVLAGNTKCTLVCDVGYRTPLTLGDFGCRANLSNPADFPLWKDTGAPAVCTLSLKIAGSVNISLKPDETLDELKADEAFAERFRKAVSDGSSGLSAHHVTIDDIGALSFRRLNERSVQVDYRILEPESATEVDKVDGGVLRGIR